MEPSPIHSSLFGMRSYSADYGKRNLNTNPATKLLTYNLFCLKDMLGNVGTEFVGVMTYRRSNNLDSIVYSTGLILDLLKC